MFSSDYCNASKFYATEVRTTQTLYPNVRILNIDVEQHPYVVDDFELESLPTISILINQKKQNTNLN